MTTREPGPSEVLTQGLRSSPRAAALRASRPAPTITAGLEVLVQEVIAAITTAPSLSLNDVPSISTWATPFCSASLPTAAVPPSAMKSDTSGLRLSRAAVSNSTLSR